MLVEINNEEFELNTKLGTTFKIEESFKDTIENDIYKNNTKNKKVEIKDIKYIGEATWQDKVNGKPISDKVFLVDVEIKEIELDVVGRCAKISYKLYGGEKTMKKVLLVMVLVFSFVLVEPMVMSQAAVTIEAAAKTKLQYKSDEIGVNGKTEISILNKKPKAKYIYSSNKKSVATVSLKGIITGKSVGTAKIIVKQKLGGKETQIGVFTVKVKKASLYSHIKKEK